jgi:nucleolar pre-ribosomal-associated protein 1
MAKRPAEPEAPSQRPAKKAKTDQPPELKTARDIHLLVAFHQDAYELRKGRRSSPFLHTESLYRTGIQAFKLFLESILYPQNDDVARHNLRILMEYLDSQRPRSEADEETCHVQHIIQTWNYAAEKNDDTLFSFTTSVLALLVKTLSSKLELRDHGLGICGTVLQPNQARLLSRGLSAPKHKEHIISPTLRLLTEIVSFDGGVMGRQLYARKDMTFEPRMMSRNLSLTKSVSEANPERAKHPSVRSNAVKYLLTNIRLQNEGVQMDIIKQTIVTKALLEGLPNDSNAQIAEILKVLEMHIIHNQHIPWIEKGRMFGERNLSLLCSLYRSGLSDQKDIDQEKSSLDIVHQFMLRLCTSHDGGVMRHSAGWYAPESKTGPGDTTEDIEVDFLPYHDPQHMNIYGEHHHPITVRNFLLADLTQHLRPYASEKEQELMLAIFTAAPELVADYWIKKVNFSFDPKLTMTWIAYSSLLCSTIRLDIPPFFGQSSGYSSHPPSLLVAMENLLPTPLNQKVLTKCINHSSRLINLFGVRILCLALQKLAKLLTLIDQASHQSTYQSWSRWRAMIISSFIRRCPKMKDIVTAFRKVPKTDLIHHEVTTRLVALYLELLPEAALEETVDISFSLIEALQQTKTVSQDPDSAIRVLELSHLINIALRSSSVSWWKRPESLKYSPFLGIVLVRTRSETDSSGSLDRLLQSIVQDFEILQPETQISGTRALICSLRGFTDAEGVLQFIDDCLQRFVRRPIIYEDELEKLISSSRRKQDDVKPISLWVMTLLEQWPYVAKTRKDSMIRIAQWLARFLTMLKNCGEDEGILKLVTQKLEMSSEEESLRSIFNSCLDKKEGIPVYKNISMITTLEEDGSTEENRIELDLSALTPPKLPPVPNFPKFKTGDIATLIESSFMANLLLSLSSEDLGIRIQTQLAIENLLPRIMSSKLDNKEMLYLLLGELVETYHIYSKKLQNPLPYLVTTFAVHAMRILSDPTHAIFPKLAGFLTLRPSWSQFRLIRHFMESVILQDPSEERDVTPWKELIWLLEWLFDGLRTPADGEILRSVGAWEALAALGAHASLGSSRARLISKSTPDTRLQHQVRTHIVKILGRAVEVDQAGTLTTRAGAFAWLNTWQNLDWIQEPLAQGLRSRLLSSVDDRVVKWSYNVLDKIAF